jgi:hypothetical protein
MAEKDIDIRFSAISDPALKEIGKVKSEILSLGVAVLGLKSFKDAVMDVGKFNDALMQTKFSANLTSAELVKFKDSLYSASLQTGVTSDSMLKMGQDALTASKDITFVNKNLKLMGDVSNVIGSNEGVGKFLSELHERTKLSGKALQDAAFDIISFSQQKGVKISAKDLISTGGELIQQLHTVLPNATALQFRTALKEALFIGKPQEYVAAQKKIFRLMGQSRSFINPMGREGPLGAMGFSEKQAITVADVISKAMKMAGGDAKKAQNILSAVFKGQGLDLSRLIVDYKEYAEAQKNADPSKVAAQAEEASVSFGAAMNDMQTAGKLFAQTELAKPIEELSKWVTKISNDGSLKKWIQDISTELKWWKVYIDQAIEGWKYIYEFTHDQEAKDIQHAHESKTKLLAQNLENYRSGKITQSQFKTNQKTIQSYNAGDVGTFPYTKPDLAPPTIQTKTPYSGEDNTGFGSGVSNNFTVTANLVVDSTKIPVKSTNATVSKTGDQATIR